MNVKKLSRDVFLLGAAITLVACASTPSPTAEYAVAKTALDSAISAGGAEFAPVELKTAQDKADQANRAITKNENLQAKRLAEQAAVDAKLAETKALAGKAEKSLKDADTSQRALKEEIQRQDNQ